MTTTHTAPAQATTLTGAPLPDLLRDAATLLDQTAHPNVWAVHVANGSQDGDDLAWSVTIYQAAPAR